MKNLFSAFFIFIYSLSHAQIWEVLYKYEVKNPQFGKVSEFPAKVECSSDGLNIFTVQFNSNKVTTPSNASGIYSYNPNPNFTYYLEHRLKNKFILISETINGKKYFFKDELPNIKYVIGTATKEVGGKKLSQLTAEFRGRKYTIWYDPKSKIKTGPWKFFQIPGLAYEISDEEQLFSWKLSGIQSATVVSDSPFKSDQSENAIISYKEYPSLRYPKTYIKPDPSQPGHYVESQRTGLETKFEWEE